MLIVLPVVRSAYMDAFTIRANVRLLEICGPLTTSSSIAATCWANNNGELVVVAVCQAYKKESKKTRKKDYTFQK